MSHRYYIYGLYDPRDHETVMVVGRTMCHPESRLVNYLGAARRNQKLGRHVSPSHQWVLDLLVQGVKPAIRVLEETDEANWAAREQWWIADWRQRNPLLRNVTDGGDGKAPGGIKEICEKHNCKRRMWPGGEWYCPECFAERHQRSQDRKKSANKTVAKGWSRPSPQERRAEKRRNNQSLRSVESRRRYAQSEENRANRRRLWAESPKPRERHQIWNKSEKGIERQHRYNRMRQDTKFAARLELTLEEYRAALAVSNREERRFQ